MHGFPELVIGGVLVAPFVLYAGAAFAIFAVLRSLLPPAGRRAESLRLGSRVANCTELKGGILAIAGLHLRRPNDAQHRRSPGYGG